MRRSNERQKNSARIDLAWSDGTTGRTTATITSSHVSRRHLRAAEKSQSHILYWTCAIPAHRISRTADFCVAWPRIATGPVWPPAPENRARLRGRIMPAVSTFSPTGDKYIDGVLMGEKWAVNSFTFSFPTDGSYYGTGY